MATPNEIAAKVLYEGMNGKAKPAKWTRAGFADWIDFDQANNVIRYGDYTFNPQEVFGLKVTDKGSFDDELERRYKAAQARYGNNQYLLNLMGFQPSKSIFGTAQQESIQQSAERAQWERSRKQFTWTDPKTGKLYNETGSGDTLLPLSEGFARMISDATWANSTNPQASRWGKSTGGSGKSPYESGKNQGIGKNPRAGLLV